MSCPFGVGDGVYNNVVNGLGQVNVIANGALAAAEDAAGAVTELISSITGITGDVHLGDTGDLSDPFTAPESDEGTPDLAFNAPTVEEPCTSLEPIKFVPKATAPDKFTAVPPVLQLPPTPDKLAANAPDNIPTLGDRALPDEPDTHLPNKPALAPLTVPQIPPLTLPVFNDTAPDKLQTSQYAVKPFTWTATDYTQTILPDVLTQIRAILGGSTGIPTAIWEMIWARARRQILRQSRKAREDAIGGWAGRGFFMPNGFLEQKLQEAIDGETDQIGELTREQAIQDSRIYVERLNTAITQGAAAEGLLIGLYQQQEQRKLEGARALVELSVAAARVVIDGYNARIAGWQAGAEVAIKRLQLELAKLDKTRIEIETQRLTVEANQQKIEQYKIDVQAVLATYDLYKAKIAAFTAQVEADRARLAVFTDQVGAYKAQVDAKTAEWNAYGESIRAEGLKTENYRAEISAFTARVQAYQAQLQAETIEPELNIKIQQLGIEQFKAQIEKFRGLVAGEQARLDAVARSAEAASRTLVALGEIEKARVTSDTTRAELMVRKAQITAQIDMENLKLKIEAAKELLNIKLAGLEAVLRAETQVGASALSALNYAAHVTAGYQNTVQCSDTYSHEE
jgi:hypothetical protein